MKPFIEIIIFKHQILIPMYGLCIMFGIAVACLVAIKLLKHTKISYYDFITIVACSGGLGLFGAKLLFVLQNYPLSEFFLQIICVQSGYVFYGGLILSIPGFFLGIKLTKVKTDIFANILACLIPLTHAFGRIGCFCAGCCYGIKYSGPFAITYTNNTIVKIPLNEPLFPVQPLEAIILVLIHILCYCSFFKETKIKFLILKIYILCYSIARFFLEFLRGDLERHFLKINKLCLSTSQCISIIIFFILWICILIELIYSKKGNRYENF